MYTAEKERKTGFAVKKCVCMRVMHHTWLGWSLGVNRNKA